MYGKARCAERLPGILNYIIFYAIIFSSKTVQSYIAIFMRKCICWDFRNFCVSMKTNFDRFEPWFSPICKFEVYNSEYSGERRRLLRRRLLCWKHGDGLFSQDADLSIRTTKNQGGVRYSPLLSIFPTISLTLLKYFQRKVFACEDHNYASAGGSYCIMKHRFDDLFFRSKRYIK